MNTKVFPRVALLIALAVAKPPVQAQTGAGHAPAMGSYTACGIRFELPKGFKIRRLAAAESCGLCISRTHCGGDEAHISLIVHEAALQQALASDSNWQADSDDGRSWKRQGYGIGSATLIDEQGRQRLGCSYSINCGPGRESGSAQACDAFAAAVSDGKRTALLDSLGLDDEAERLWVSIRFVSRPAEGPLQRGSR